MCSSIHLDPFSKFLLGVFLFFAVSETLLVSLNENCRIFSDYKDSLSRVKCSWRGCYRNSKWWREPWSAPRPPPNTTFIYGLFWAGGRWESTVVERSLLRASLILEQKLLRNEDGHKFSLRGGSFVAMKKWKVRTNAGLHKQTLLNNLYLALVSPK